VKERLDDVAFDSSFASGVSEGVNYKIGAETRFESAVGFCLELIQELCGVVVRLVGGAIDDLISNADQGIDIANRLLLGLAQQFGGPTKTGRVGSYYFGRSALGGLGVEA
jgi:hypothetical protein